jgi:hypothetical protein
VQALESHELVTLMAALVGLDPAKDIHWITDPAVKPIELFEQGKIDAFLAFPPEPQDLRTRTQQTLSSNQENFASIRTLLSLTNVEPEVPLVAI